MKGTAIVERGVTAGQRLGAWWAAKGLGQARHKRGLSTVETIALTVVVVGAVVGAAAVLNPKLNDLIGRAFDRIAENLGL